LVDLLRGQARRQIREDRLLRDDLLQHARRQPAMRFIDVPRRQVEHVLCAAVVGPLAWNGQDDADIFATDRHQKPDGLRVAPARRSQDFLKAFGPERFALLRKAPRQNGEGITEIAIVDGAKFHDGQVRSISIMTSAASNGGLRPNAPIPVDRAFCRDGVAAVNVKE
jgi:hypothetical protein